MFQFVLCGSFAGCAADRNRFWWRGMTDAIMWRSSWTTSRARTYRSTRHAEPNFSRLAESGSHPGGQSSSPIDSLTGIPSAGSRRRRDGDGQPPAFASARSSWVTRAGARLRFFLDQDLRGSETAKVFGWCGFSMYAAGTPIIARPSFARMHAAAWKHSLSTPATCWAGRTGWISHALEAPVILTDAFILS